MLNLFFRVLSYSNTGFECAGWYEAREKKKSTLQILCSQACFPFCASQYNSPVLQITSRSTRDLHKSKSNLESLFCYDKAVPEENIEKPVGLSLDKVNIGNKPPCSICEAKGAVLCATCSGSGLYIDSILESQGIIVKVRCLGNMLHLFPFCFLWFVFKLDYLRNIA